ncbi:MAG TPA: hypothetical protein VMA34_20620 [Terracidiphilus sp.]|nr:hypothetical protein [Terracidiphilus sp.]
MPISTRDLSQMPTIVNLERLCQSIAMLDAILSPEWEYRYFSFNAAWDTSSSERMASMRNGAGDDYFLVFSPHGAILKGFDHEAPMNPRTNTIAAVWPGVLDHVPAAFGSFLSEPAFSMADCTFCIWREADDEQWHRGPIAFPRGDDPDGSEGLLWMFDGEPETYADYAYQYFEKTVDVDLVRRIYAHEPLTRLLMTGLNAQASWEDTAKDAGEIHYPLQS